MLYDLVLRIWSLLRSPGQEWERIKASAEKPHRLSLRWILPLAAVPFLSALIGFTFIAPACSTLAPEFSIRLQNGLTHGLLLALASSLSVYLAAYAYRISRQLSGDAESYATVLELYARSWAPVWLAGIFYLLPSLGRLSLLGALVSLWLLYRGLQVLFGYRGRKVFWQTAVAAGIFCAAHLIACFIVAAVLCKIFSVGMFI